MDAASEAFRDTIVIDSDLVLLVCESDVAECSFLSVILGANAFDK